jgi:DNA-binding XRE family transcriptional regulator
MLGNELRVWRKKYGWTLVNVSSCTGISTSVLSDMERGKIEPTLASLRKLAKLYGVTPGTLLDGGDESQVAPIQLQPVWNLHGVVPRCCETCLYLEHGEGVSNCKRPDGPSYDTGDRMFLLTVCDMWRNGMKEEVTE